MQVAIFAEASEAGFAHDWERETAIAVFGSATLDLTRRPPLAAATLTVAAIFGAIKVIVPPGTRVISRGITLFSGSRVRVQSGGGPEIAINSLALFGDIKVVEGKGSALPELPAGGPTFPY